MEVTRQKLPMPNLNFAISAIVAMAMSLPASGHYVDAGGYSANKGQSGKTAGLKKGAQASSSGQVDPWDRLIQALSPPALALGANVSLTNQADLLCRKP